MNSADTVYQKPFPLTEDPSTEWRFLGAEGIRVSSFEGRDMLVIEPAALRRLARIAMRDCSFLLRPAHLKQVAAILDDPEASANDRGVALTLLRNAEVAAKGLLPLCQDTGTATVIAKKGQSVWTGFEDAAEITAGIAEVYATENLRYSQTVALDMYREVNSGNNLPAQIDLIATSGDAYEFLFAAKGGGSANKTMLWQETKALLNRETLEPYLIAKMKSLGTAACPPYHIAFVIGGTSAEACLKAVKLASMKELDGLPSVGNRAGQAFRDRGLEAKLLEAAHNLGIGAQFGGKYFALDVRVIRLPRHGASCPVGMGVSCSADRQVKARIDRKGLWIEQLELNPGRFIPPAFKGTSSFSASAVRVNLDRPMPEILGQLSKYPVTTPLLLSGTLIVARDIAHAKFKERLDAGQDLPEYLKNHPVYYAGPAKTPEGMPSGSFGPTTAGRMDAYVDLLQSKGGSMIMIAKGNRSGEVTEACKRHGGFYLGSIGGPAALLAQENILKVELLEYPELGMEAVYRIEVRDFPAFILVDDKGNDFFRQIGGCASCRK
jgi:fumarate hydratase class I